MLVIICRLAGSQCVLNYSAVVIHSIDLHVTQWCWQWEMYNTNNNSTTVCILNFRVGDAQYKLDVAALAKTVGASSSQDVTQILSQISVSCYEPLWCNYFLNEMAKLVLLVVLVEWNKWHILLFLCYFLLYIYIIVLCLTCWKQNKC